MEKDEEKKNGRKHNPLNNIRNGKKQYYMNKNNNKNKKKRYKNGNVNAKKNNIILACMWKLF